MRYFLTVFGLLIFSFSSFAHHVKGGYIRYEYAGSGSAAGTSLYKVTVTVFYGCGIQGPRGSVTLNALNASTGASVLSTTIATTTSATVTKGTYNPCMSNPPTICYEVYTYVATITLANNTSGYILAVTDEYRTDNIINISNSSSTGIAITAPIPGAINLVNYNTNTSPVFAFKDTAIICYRGTFTYQFSASDPVDNDSLSYSFGNGLNINSTSAAPFFAPLTYNSGYSGAAPMGSGVTINPVTGLISGTAPATTGEYVIAVYVSEWRNGVLIDSIKKELQIFVYDCSLIGATLNPSYINCNNYTFNFQNQSTASNITSYYWDFGVGNTTSDVSTLPTPTYTYADTGSYTLTLKVGTSGGCEDSTTALVKVYPGFSPGFTVTGSCYQSPFLFTDTTSPKYGTVNSRNWNFGDNTTTADTSSVKNPSYQYPAPGTATVTLSVTSTKGCSDTMSKVITINNKPSLYLPFTDTLICSKDSLPLIVQSTATSYSWRPAYNIINPNTANPVVFPKDTTVYTVTVTDQGCVDSASVKVNVLDFITIKIAADTAICKTDSFTLRPVSDALSYKWTESTGLNSLNSNRVKFPRAAPSVTTTYYVTANLGYCQDKTQTTVYVAPYPTVSAGNDTAICYGTTAQLSGTTNSPIHKWTPAYSLTSPAALQTTATPRVTTEYVLTVKDTSYCIKTVSDTVTVKVIQPLKLSAGNDTSVVVGQPLQLVATFDTSYNYQWSPSTWMNNNFLYNPLVTITSTTIDSIVYKVTASTIQGCSASDFITVKIFKTQPDIFVPTAFTPNADGKNDLLKPILVGISKLDYFRVFNRWGQVVFTTSESGKGWDGTVSGTQQNTGTFVFMAQGTDYLGKRVFRKGTVVLIR